MNNKRKELTQKMSDLGYTREQVADIFDVSTRTIYRALKNPDKYANLINNLYRLLAAVEQDKQPEVAIDEEEVSNKEKEPKGKKTISRSGNKLEATVITTKNPSNLKPEEIIELFELDPKKWEMVSFKANSWNTTMKDNSGHPMTSRNWSIKSHFKLKQKEKPDEEDLDWLFEKGRKASFQKYGIDGATNKTYENLESDNTLVLAIFDQHLGKLAWGEETGENYDIKIGSKRFLEKAKSILDRAYKIGFKKIIFPLGNDFFQMDNTESETTRGTRVDSDIRWKKLFPLGIDLLREVIDYGSKLAPVDVLLVQGNHDTMMSFYAFECLRGYYYDNPNVKIDKDVRTRTYRQIGVNLIGFTHGDKEKDRIYEIMQHEARKDWGKTKYSEWITGHYHKSYVDEKKGVTKRVVGSLTGTDAWHYESGFVGALKSAQGILYNEHRLGPYVIVYETVDISKEKEQE